MHMNCHLLHKLYIDRNVFQYQGCSHTLLPAHTKQKNLMFHTNDIYVFYHFCHCALNTTPYSRISGYQVQRQRAIKIWTPLNLQWSGCIRRAVLPSRVCMGTRLSANEPFGILYGLIQLKVTKEIVRNQQNIEAYSDAHYLAVAFNTNT